MTLHENDLCVLQYEPIYLRFYYLIWLQQNGWSAIPEYRLIRLKSYSCVAH